MTSLSATGYQVRFGVDDEIGVVQNAALREPRAPQRRSQMRNELAELKGFGQIIVRADC